MIDNSLFIRAINNETQALMEIGEIYFNGCEGEENKEKATVFFGKAVENALKKAKSSDVSELEILVRFLEKYFTENDKKVIGVPENDMRDVFSNSDEFMKNKAVFFMNEGKKYFANEKYETAADRFEKAILHGDSESEALLTETKMKLAYKAYYGTDRAADYVKSEKYFKEVAESKDERFLVESKMCLAELYVTRLNKKEDAVEIWRELASKGVADAQYNYGLALFNGMGVAQDEEMGVYWWQKAAKNGHADAKYNVDVFFSDI